MSPARRFRTFTDFWPHYLGEHAALITRRLHLVGTGLALVCLAMLAYTGDLWFFAAALAAGYGFAWVAHLVVERNRPTTLSHPWWSLLADFRMLALACVGRLDAELQRYQIRPR